MIWTPFIQKVNNYTLNLTLLLDSEEYRLKTHYCPCNVIYFKTVLSHFTGRSADEVFT